MKKLIFTSLICVGLLLFGNAKAAAQFNIGIRGSMNITTVNGINFDTESITGYAFGAYANIAIPNSPVGIQPEILYTQKGFQSSTGLENQDSEVMYKLEYIEIPLLARVSFGKSGKVIPYIYGGTYLGLKINSETESKEVEFEVENFNDTDYGFIVGAGVNIGLLNIEARYDGGLAEVSENSDVKNGVITIAAGIEL